MSSPGCPPATERTARIEEILVIADGEMPEDLAFHADGGVHQQGRPGGAEPPVDRGELVDQVTGLLAERASEVYLILAQEMEARCQSWLGGAPRVWLTFEMHTRKLSG